MVKVSWGWIILFYNNNKTWVYFIIIYSIQLIQLIKIKG